MILIRQFNSSHTHCAIDGPDSTSKGRNVCFPMAISDVPGLLNVLLIPLDMKIRAARSV